ncbi:MULTISPECIES: amino acid adenylation domain-containing protein [unclassified Streptomyces]|uniref:amino acid adenylation domain-containing protein n=1 Tax=unclassified Streptomyces TaxID=2593676 RepID=UPI0016620A9C|nr:MULTISPECIES: amino acid adenylation domain-containing protein [unclassified Streptomyces]MBD0844693.1 amino acid adenylation domain-containing protein [Streptomyces sp. TRM68416]
MTLHRLVADAAKVHGGRTALVAADGELTYAELDSAADRLARGLRALGVTRGDRVVIWGEKSIAVITAMQAVLRLGAAYVPADGSAPGHRVAVLARDCAARVVLTTGERAAPLGELLADEVTVAELAATREQGTDEPQDARIDEPADPDDLAYILYTSGSTGAPKGVCISHRNALSFVEWAVRELAPGPGDRFANHAPLNFDLSVLDLYAAFSVGASVHLIAAELAYAPAQLVDFLHEQRITVWYSVPSALTLMMREGGLLERQPPQGLRAVLFAGEPFPIAQVRALADWTPARLLNLYGPTETNVCTFHEVRPQDLERDRPVPIGVACSGDRVWARRSDGEVCGPGEEGELVADGPTVMLGYWGREPHRGPYPTGDVVRVLEPGLFDYVGRRDHMVKVRGHRIELGDVEASLTAHPAVAEAVALVVGSGIEARLVAFVVPAKGEDVGVLELRRHCAEHLPRYMVADEFRTTPELPRTRNGKADRAALAAVLQ